jgi:hypothetical protein
MQEIAIQRNCFISLKLFLLLSIYVVQSAHGGILTPPYFNLVSNKRVEATATCGEGVEKELYCKLTGSTATDRETQSYANLIQVTNSCNKNSQTDP